MPAISAQNRRPVDIVTYTTTDASNWVPLVLPPFARVVTVQAPSGGPTVHVSTRETGAYAAGADQVHVTPGGSVTIRLTGGRAPASNEAGRTISVHTGGVSDLVHLLIEES